MPGENLQHGTAQIRCAIKVVLRVRDHAPEIELWDGKTAHRIVAALKQEQSESGPVGPATEAPIEVGARSDMRTAGEL